MCCGVQESSEEESNKEKSEGVVVEKEVQVTAEEEMEEVDLGSALQGLRPISISASLMEKEKNRSSTVVERIQRRIHLGLQRNARARPWVSCTYVKCGPAGQASSPAFQDISHRNKRADSQRGVEVAGRRIHQAYLASSLAIQHSTSEEEEWPDKMLCRF